MKNKLTNETPWHNEPYVWLVIAFPLLAIIGGVVTIWLAISSDDGLVVDDYYKKGLEINKTLQRDIQAENYNLKANINIDNAAGTLTINLQANEHFIYPAQLHVQLMHATRKNHDQNIIINKIADNKYETTVPELTRGTWYIQIEKQDWRLIKSIHIN